MTTPDVYQYYKKAHQIHEVRNAVRFSVPIPADHAFFTDFSDVRGEFEDRLVFRTLNVDPVSFAYLGGDSPFKEILFIAGMRGSGKTSELSKISQKLHRKDAFFCVTCNLDEGLDINNLEYMDILIYQLERLFEELGNADLEVDEDIIGELQTWFGEQVQEINKKFEKEGELELEVKAGPPSILGFLGLTAKVKSRLAGTQSNAETVRSVFRNRFSDFSLKFNKFIRQITTLLRRYGLAQEVLFIIDGLEKTGTFEIRRRVVIDEANRIQQIKAHTIFTLPLELMPERPRLISFSTVISFPFVKIQEMDGALVEEAIARFEEFVYKRVDEGLFDSPETVREAILMCGGSPRELLRILEYAELYSDPAAGSITRAALDKGIHKLAAEASRYLSKEDLEKLKALKLANEQGIELEFDLSWHDMLEKLIVLEYNDGTYKRVNPIVARSKRYQQHVEG